MQLALQRGIACAQLGKESILPDGGLEHALLYAGGHSMNSLGGSVHLLGGGLQACVLARHSMFQVGQRVCHMPMQALQKALHRVLPVHLSY